MPKITPETVRFFEEVFQQMRSTAAPAAKVTAQFKRKYPRLMSKIDMRIGNTGPALGFTGLKPRGQGQGFWNWMKSPAQPRIVLSGRDIPVTAGYAKGWSPEKTMKFAAGHEVQHAREMLGKSNARFVGHTLLNKAFVPYGWRANEWRANTVGAQVAKLTPDELWKMRSQNLAMGAYGAGVRTAAGGGAYALYRRRQQRRKI